MNDNGEVYTISNATTANITISGGTSAATGTTTFTINDSTSGGQYWITPDNNLYYDGGIAWNDPIDEMKNLVNAMVEDFLEKYQ